MGGKLRARLGRLPAGVLAEEIQAEVYAVGKTQLSPALLAGLRESVERSRTHLEANDKRRYIEEDVNFHASLTAASGNELLTEILRNVQHQVWLFRRKTYDLSRSKATDTHAAIVRALEKGDSFGKIVIEL